MYTDLIDGILNSKEQHIELECRTFQIDDFSTIIKLVTRLQNDLLARVWLKVIVEDGQIKLFFEIDKEKI